MAPAESRHVAAVETWPRGACDKGHMGRSHSTTKPVTPTTTPTAPIVSVSRSDLYRGRFHHLYCIPERERMKRPLQNPGAVLHPRLWGTAGRALHTARRAVHRRRVHPHLYCIPERERMKRPLQNPGAVLHPRLWGTAGRALHTARSVVHRRRKVPSTWRSATSRTAPSCTARSSVHRQERRAPSRKAP